MKQLVPRLLLLISLALLPVLGFEAYGEYTARQTRQQLVQEQALRLVRLVSSEQQRIIDGASDVLTALAGTPAIQNIQRPQCDQILSNFVGKLPRYNTAIVVGLDGFVRCAATPFERPPNVSDRFYFQEALRTGGFTVGEYILGRFRDKPSISFARPFTNSEGAVVGIVQLSLDLHWLGEQLTKLPLPPRSGVTVTDRNGTILARVPAGDIGKPTVDRNRGLLVGDQIRLVHTTNRAGREVITGYSPPGADPKGLMVAVWLDRETAFTEVTQANRFGLLLIVGGAVLASLIATFLGARLIKHPFGQLLAAAQRWGRNDLGVRTGVPHDRTEFGRLAAAFDDMADKLATHQKAEAELRAEQAQKAEVLDTIDEAFLTLDSDLHFTYVNRRFLEIYGLQADAVLGREFHDVFPAAIGATPPRMYRDVIADRVTREFDSLSPTLGRWHHVKACPAPDGGVAVYFHDIHDRKLAEEQLRRLNEQLEQRVREEVAARETLQRQTAHAERMQALGQLAGGIAHDFNNILQTIEGASALIQRRTKNDSGVGRMARVVSEAVARGTSITGRLLTFGRHTNITSGPLDIALLLIDMREVFLHTLGKGIEIDISPSDDLPPVLADKGQLETALTNLATNARDAMPGGGRLTLSAEADAIPTVGRVHPINLPPGQYVKFTVADTGTGMDAETLKRATEPFFTTKRNDKGTGLGLPMVYGFVEQSHGAMTIASTPGDGTTVTFWLPVADRRGATATRVPAQSAPAKPKPSARPKLLLVDDEDLLREVLAEQLGEAGFDVAVAANGAEAINLLAAGQAIDTLITDLSMPGMDGIAVIRAARERYPGLPALLLTGYAGDSDEIAEGQMADDFSVMRKPVRLNELTERLEALLQWRGSSGTLMVE